MFKLNTPKAKQAIILVCVLFFALGFFTWLNSALIPFLKVLCNLTDFQSYLVEFAFYISYFVGSIPSSYLLRSKGYKYCILLAFLLLAGGSLIFIPASILRNYNIFLFALAIQGGGMIFLQLAVDQYLVVISPTNSAARVISLGGLLNKLAGLISSLWLSNTLLDQIKMTSIDLANVVTLQRKEELLSVLGNKIIPPYIMLFILAMGIFVFVYFCTFVDLKGEEEISHNRYKAVFRDKNLLYGFCALFCGVGVEVLAVITVISFAKSLGLDFNEMDLFFITVKDLTIFLPALSLAFMILGYIVGIILIPNILSQRRSLMLYSFFGILISFLVSFVVPNGVFFKYLLVFAVCSLGFVNSLTWPVIWPLALKYAKKYRSLATAILVSGILGGALMPLIYSKLGVYIGLQKSYIVMTFGYSIIFFYASSRTED